MEIALSLGTNEGDRLANLSRAAGLIESIPGTATIARSNVYETEPVDVLPEHRDLAFLNAVLVVETDLAPAALAAHLHTIENLMGRNRGPNPNAPRPIDIDVLYAGCEESTSPDLTIPHPRWSGRRFVVQPLADVRPDTVLPCEVRTVREILLALPDTPKVLLFCRDW